MRKKVGILICVLLALILCVHIAALCDYSGLVLRNTFGFDCEGPDDYVQFGLNMIFQNNFGRTAIYSLEDYKPVGTYAPKIATHFSMLSLRPGMSIEEVVAAVGKPDSNASGGLSYLSYKTVDGYIYLLRFEGQKRTYSNCVILTPEEGNPNVENANAFQWQVRFFYLGVAAVLSVILVCLLVIPKKMQKRKQTA